MKNIKITEEQLLSKLSSVELCLSAHPDNEEHSEFADRILDLQELQKKVGDLIEWKKSAMKNIFRASQIDYLDEQIKNIKCKY